MKRAGCRVWPATLLLLSVAPLAAQAGLTGAAIAGTVRNAANEALGDASVEVA